MSWWAAGADVPDPRGEAQSVLAAQRAMATVAGNSRTSTRSAVDELLFRVLVALDARRLLGREGEEVVVRHPDSADVDRERGPAQPPARAEVVAGVSAPSAVLGHADGERALVEEVELLDRLAEVVDVLAERVDLLLEVLDPFVQRGLLSSCQRRRREDA